MDSGEERDVERDEGAQARSPWQFSLRGLLGVTAALAVVCSVVAWWGVPAVAAILGGAVGAFVGGLVCPLLGLDVVLDDLRRDLAKCLGVGAYIVGGTWAVIVGLGWVVRTVHGEDAPVFVSGGLLLLVAFTVALVVKTLWSDSDNPEVVVVTFAALIGVFAAVSMTVPLVVPQ